MPKSRAAISDPIEEARAHVRQLSAAQRLLGQQLAAFGPVDLSQVALPTCFSTNAVDAIKEIATDLRRLPNAGEPWWAALQQAGRLVAYALKCGALATDDRRGQRLTIEDSLRHGLDGPAFA